jgi:hypothetical protein
MNENVSGSASIVKSCKKLAELNFGPIITDLKVVCCEINTRLHPESIYLSTDHNMFLAENRDYRCECCCHFHTVLILNHTGCKSVLAAVPSQG